MTYASKTYKGPLDLSFDLRTSAEYRNFPDDVQHIVNGGIIKIKNKYFNSYLKLADSADWSGDRVLWGGNPSKPSESDEKPDRFLWHIYRVEADQGSVKCFVVQNVRFGQYLKAGWKAESDGDRQNYGNNAEKGIEKDEGKERFFLRFERIADDTYTISNERFGGAPWKMGWKEDSDGDRKVVCADSAKGIEQDSPERYHWVLEPAKFHF